ncbi:Putative transposase of IS4/5 family [Nitrosospira multiformis ATCC 25196]|uniref:Putative transposase of IS4/5 family n=1 Tax=Nitrosospira multiformis (strain ATCC 25196 / NCIMB 11849 / C 71) TaxID=323848 RepID=Q2YBE1_NITMU|nr:transposase [Nitrosospira multiformis]ABB73930.1 hypothetical protein Nmul_A0623 [Nitrosospira multiformis ATCC 25196]SEG18497.1 Putative transposase of IS4/5 family [Nitrosospira multiformis ATCC 25196]
MKDLFYLSETQFNRIKPYFPLSHGFPGLMICGIIYVIRNGLQWKDAPREYGPHKTLYNRSCAGADWACSTASLRNCLVKRKRPTAGNRFHAS